MAHASKAPSVGWPCNVPSTIWALLQITAAYRTNDSRTLIRIRTILLLGYWVLSNIHRYWIVLLLGDIFCCSDTQYNTNQTAVSTIHMPVNDYLVPLVTAAIICLDTVLICCCLLNTIIVIIIEFRDFSWSLLCYTLVSVLVLGIGIARGQYYWVLNIGCLSWYGSNLTSDVSYTHEPRSRNWQHKSTPSKGARFWYL